MERRLERRYLSSWSINGVKLACKVSAMTLNDSEEELAEPVEFQPMVGKGEPAWDKGPENEGEIFDVSSTFFHLLHGWIPTTSAGPALRWGGRLIVLPSVKSHVRIRRQSPFLSRVPHPYRWVLRIGLVVSARDPTTPAMVLQYTAIPTSSPWRVPAKLCLQVFPSVES